VALLYLPEKKNTGAEVEGMLNLNSMLNNGRSEVNSLLAKKFACSSERW